MDEDAYRRKGVAALIAIKGDIEGRVILDLSSGSGDESGEACSRFEVETAPGGTGNGLRGWQNIGYRKFRNVAERPDFSFKVFPHGNSAWMKWGWRQRVTGSVR